MMFGQSNLWIILQLREYFVELFGFVAFKAWFSILLSRVVNIILMLSVC
jgi:hypothetical protein